MLLLDHVRINVQYRGIRKIVWDSWIMILTSKVNTHLCLRFSRLKSPIREWTFLISIPFNDTKLPFLGLILSVSPIPIVRRQRLSVMESFNRASFSRPSWARQYSLSQVSMYHWQQQNLLRWRTRVCKFTETRKLSEIL